MNKNIYDEGTLKYFEMLTGLHKVLKVMTGRKYSPRVNHHKVECSENRRGFLAGYGQLDLQQRRVVT